MPASARGGKVEEIPLPWHEVVAYYDPWIGTTQCESYAITWLSQNPAYLDKVDGGGWKLSGIEVWLRRGKRGKNGKKGRKGARADLVFMRGKDYLVVEAEDSWTERNILEGKKQAKRYARLLEAHLERMYPMHGKVLSAVAAVDFSSAEENKYGYLCGQEWSAGQMKSRHSGVAVTTNSS